MSKSFWVMRMRQGSDGEDFAKELWSNGRVGILYGTWRIWHVTDASGRVDPDKLRPEHIQSVCPQPPFFQPKWLRGTVKRFLTEMSEGDRVLIAFDDYLHLGVIGEGFRDDETPRGPTREHFKCRPIISAKRFSLRTLPSVYRLFSTLQGTLVRPNAYRIQAMLLDESRDEEHLRRILNQLTPQSFIKMLSPWEWEVLCMEYLHDVAQFKLLRLKPGGSLKDVDLVGVDASGNRIVAQCKNDSKPWAVAAVKDWAKSAALASDDTPVFCCRGGVEGDRDALGCVVIDGRMIADWLERNPVYFGALKQK